MINVHVKHQNKPNCSGIKGILVCILIFCYNTSPTYACLWMPYSVETTALVVVVETDEKCSLSGGF